MFDLINAYFAALNTYELAVDSKDVAKAKVMAKRAQTNLLDHVYRIKGSAKLRERGRHYLMCMYEADSIRRGGRTME